MSDKKQRTFLFVDGSNLYAGQYKLFGPNKYLDFSEFIRQIELKLKVEFDKIYFYASYSPKLKEPTKKQKLYLRNEALFYRSVKKTKKVVFFKGYRSKTSGKEKEVDVKLAVDIVDFAHRNKYDQLFLFSGDADFMHAVVCARRLNKKIAILALENRIPNRFAYTYKTFVFVISNKKLKIHSKQKIKTIGIDDKNILGS